MKKQFCIIPFHLRISIWFTKYYNIILLASKYCVKWRTVYVVFDEMLSTNGSKKLSILALQAHSAKEIIDFTAGSCYHVAPLTQLPREKGHSNTLLPSLKRREIEWSQLNEPFKGFMYKLECLLWFRLPQI